MTKRIMIVDYGFGNVRSVLNAFNFIGAKAFLSNQLSDLQKAQAIVVPGQGAFRDCMRNLNELHFTQALKDVVIKKRKPYLGICLGLQILAEKSFEGGEFRGLGWIPGVVKRFSPVSTRYKVPHLGWNDVKITKPSPLFLSVSSPTFYFAHSFYLAPKRQDKVVAVCDYGVPFAAAVSSNNIHAVQFHPEKSQQAGLQLLKNFTSLL